MKPDVQVRYADELAVLKERFKSLAMRGMMVGQEVFVDTMQDVILEYLCGDNLEAWDRIYRAYHARLFDIADEAEEQLKAGEAEQRKAQLTEGVNLNQEAHRAALRAISEKG